MSIFNTILEKLGLHKAQPAPTTAAKPGASVDLGAKATAGAPGQTATKEAPPKAVSEVDVVKKLEQLAAGKGLNWKVSIVDLLTLLGMDSSREARKELAVELGCPPEMMSDSARMNVWLHKTVLRKIAENGGNIPQSLLD
jgi:hypothetical protein